MHSNYLYEQNKFVLILFSSASNLKELFSVFKMSVPTFQKKSSWLMDIQKFNLTAPFSFPYASYSVEYC